MEESSFIKQSGADDRIREVLSEWDKEYTVTNGVISRRDGGEMPVYIDHLNLICSPSRTKEDDKMKEVRRVLSESLSSRK